MKPDLSNKIILITGAGRGLGRHAACHLSACGAVMGVADIDPVTSEETATEIRRAGGQAYAYSGDMSDRDTYLGIAARLAEVNGRIDCVINNAMLLHYEPVEAIREELLDRMLAIGIKAAVWGAQALLLHYAQKHGGAIINMASPVVHRGYPNTAATELGPRGIRVNAVSPASVPTPGAIGMVSREEYARRAVTIPLRRIGHEQDNSNAIAFLLSTEASFINGEVLNVDGGAAVS